MRGSLSLANLLQNYKKSIKERPYCQFADGAFLQNNLRCLSTKNLKEYAKKSSHRSKNVIK